MKIKKETVLISSVILATMLFPLFSCKQKAVTPFDHPEWSRNATIYEVNVRQFTPEGTFRAFEEHLPRLQQMGVKILWLMPINPIGEENRKGTLGSYYAVKDYLEVNPAYGTKKDFRHLVEKIHELGMYVIIDWVANHTAWDNPLLVEHPEWYLKDSTGAIIPPVADWSDVAGLDYSNPALWGYMSDALQYWVREFNIDGYRCDVAGMLPVGFWNRAVPEIKKLKPIFMLAEWETPDMHDTAFDATYSWDFYHLMNELAKEEKPLRDIDTLLKKERKSYPSHAFRMRFTSNHDENSWNGTEYERLGEAAQAFALLTFTFPGIPLIYTGQESAMNKRLSFFDKDTVPWLDYPLGPFYTRLVKLKLDHPVLDAGETGGTYQRVHSTNDSAVLAFVRKNPEEQILVVLNLSPKEQEVGLKGKDFSGAYTEIFTQANVTLGKGKTLTLEPWGYRVYVISD
ncbi:MAG: alpha-amylase [Bacteroidetes bacterium]|nr:MAG: alpha-amylase [Bacteroidota bacterium]